MFLLWADMVWVGWFGRLTRIRTVRQSPHNLSKQEFDRHLATAHLLPRVAIGYRGLAILSVLRESIALAVSHDDGLASCKTVVPEELIQRPLVLLSGQAKLI